jgi:hypothetical protein
MFPRRFVLHRMISKKPVPAKAAIPIFGQDHANEARATTID